MANSNQSTLATFQIIEAMASIGESARITELARMLDMPRARVYRYLQTLVSIGYAQQDPETERYKLTLKLFHLGQAVAESTELTALARPQMARLRTETECTVTFSLLEAQGMRVAEIVRVDSPVQIVTRPGSLLSFHASAQGKLALAFGDPENWDQVRAAKLQAFTDRTITDLATLEAQVAEVAKQGWATAPEETLRGVNALSAPIFDARARLVATLTIAASVQDISEPPSQKQIKAVVTAARRISENLGYTRGDVI
ncbi:helix-turn-helix domain-containing protein [Alphaproteobacteria bacterium GH1-50]|uniref:Helix-turn-helix domain-containing protein n=1 Tax=Kangsaoukella pontilimi TaxID=2691042 RepID=A0A7C9J254_9RHOB|nr:IclR family transcriptional regulator [Kangsaoukella pontilimi]MXQ07341.1 helix-turn-helix domain-containing protein [Kangsaoukella pontilimi]